MNCVFIQVSKLFPQDAQLPCQVGRVALGPMYEYRTARESIFEYRYQLNEFLLNDMELPWSIGTELYI